VDRIEEARLAWQRAQAELQKALAELELRVADAADVSLVTRARSRVTEQQKMADDLLGRYITHLGKSQ
jgi:hypothetical protein